MLKRKNVKLRVLAFVCAVVCIEILSMGTFAQQTLRKKADYELGIGEKDGLRITAEIFKREYKVQDEMYIALTFENVSDKALYFSKHQSGNFGAAMFATFTFSPCGGHGVIDKRKRLTNYVKPQLFIEDFIFIAPKDKYTTTISINLYDWELFPGEFCFIAAYSSLWSQNDVSALKGV